MKRFLMFTGLLALAVSGVALAGSPARPARLGLCAACHGERGIAVAPGVPNLAAQHADYLLDAMRQYRDGHRDVTVMRAALGPLSTAQLKALAQWYAAQPGAQPHKKEKR